MRVILKYTRHGDKWRLQKYLKRMRGSGMFDFAKWNIDLSYISGDL